MNDSASEFTKMGVLVEIIRNKTIAKTSFENFGLIYKNLSSYPDDSWLKILISSMIPHSKPTQFHTFIDPIIMQEKPGLILATYGSGRHWILSDVPYGISDFSFEKDIFELETFYQNEINTRYNTLLRSRVRQLELRRTAMVNNDTFRKT